MTLAGGTFPSALPPPRTRGQTWRCQKSSAMVDRNTWHGRHEKTALTLCPAPEHGAEEMPRSSISSFPTQSHLDHLTDTCPCHEPAEHPSLFMSPAHPGGRTAPGGWWSTHGWLRRKKLEETHTGGRGTHMQ